MASGRSFKNFFTRNGGARNCLKVTVTNTEVWIRPFFPFAFLAPTFDLEHRIPRSRIESALIGESLFTSPVNLLYRDDQARPRRLSLVLRNPEAFMQALDIPASAAYGR